jgi:hypothetical protein
MFELLKIMPLAKVDEATRTVYGICTAEVPDSENELCDYTAAKADYTRWSKEKAAITKAAGQDLSFGNVRLQHSSTVGGKVIEMPTFDDEGKGISIKTAPIDDAVWKQLKGGFYTGYSQGGSYLWRECNECQTPIAKRNGNACPTCKKDVLVRYAPVVSEVSYVDSPAVDTAVFQYVKADGSTEMRKFQPKGTTMPDEAEAIAQRAADLVIEKQNKAATDAEAATAALAKSEARKKTILAKFTAELEKATAGKTLRKGLYSVSAFAQILGDIYCLARGSAEEEAWEDDSDSTMPEALMALLAEASKQFLAMATEETQELTAAEKATKGTDSMKPELMKAVSAANFASQKALAEANAANHDAVAKSHQDVAKALEEKDADNPMVAYHKAQCVASEQLAKTSREQAAAIAVQADALNAADDDDSVAKAVASLSAPVVVRDAPAAVVTETGDEIGTFIKGETDKLTRELLLKSMNDVKNSPEFAAKISEMAAARVNEIRRSPARSPRRHAACKG